MHVRLQNAVIVELAKITDKGVQELQLLSNEDLAVEVLSMLIGITNDVANLTCFGWH